MADIDERERERDHETRPLPRRRGRRGLMYGLGWPARAALGVGAVVLLVLALLGSVSLIRGLNPFTHQTIDRSQPPVLKSIRDLSQFHAAVGDFEVVIDVESSIKHIPTTLAGERTLFVAAGTVDAYIDFSHLADRDIKVVDKSVTIRLPAPQLAKTSLDQNRSYVFSQHRGLWDRLAALVSTEDQQQFYVLAEQRIGEAAKSAGILQRATTNTKAMLTNLMKSLGFTVTFVDAPQG